MSLDAWPQLEVQQGVEVQVFLYNDPADTFTVVLENGGTRTDISSFVTAVTQSEAEARVTLSWHEELFGEPQPQIGRLIEVELNGLRLFLMRIDSISSYEESRGARTMQIVLRSRDSVPYWRDTKMITPVYPLGTDLAAIMADIAENLQLTAIDNLLPVSLGVSTPHTTLQLAQIAPWEMLTTMGMAVGSTPFVDAWGRLKLISRDVTSPVTREITADRIIRIGDSRSLPPVSVVRLKWLSPELTEVETEDQKLGFVTMTAGFFQLTVEKDMWFSEDHTQRAKNVRLEIKQSCNTGLLNVANEEWVPVDLYHGKIVLTTHVWVPLLATASLIEMVSYGNVPDYAPPGGGATIPWGKVLHAGAEGAILLIMMSIGTGTYEVWGTPYDFVHEVNTTEARNPLVPMWEERMEELSNDFMGVEEQAQAMAVRELMYRSLESNSFSMEIVDDPSIEPGDILGLPGGMKMYVTGYSRDWVKRGNVHTFSVSGFRVA